MGKTGDFRLDVGIVLNVNSCYFLLTLDKMS